MKRTILLAILAPLAVLLWANIALLYTGWPLSVRMAIATTAIPLGAAFLGMTILYRLEEPRR